MRNILILLLLSTRVMAGDPQYPVSAIPAALTQHANAVVREEETIIRLNSLKDMRTLHRYVITIFNESGAEHAALYEWYDKHHKIESIRGTLYDASGNVIRKLKQSDIKDESAVSDNSLMDDNRSKSHNFYHRVYPYTIEYEVESRAMHTFVLPGWYPQSDNQLSVQQSRMSITVPADYKLRFKQFNYTGEPVKTTGKDDITFSWQVKDMKALIAEPLAPALHYRTTVVYLAPDRFAYDDYTGLMNTWQEYGRFVQTLNTGRDQLPDKTKSDVHALTDNVKDPREKTRLLYQYMQQHTRYISIQLGIGGLQPFDATYVSTKGYGDCKALSNYMVALLKEAGIRAHYVLVKAGQGRTDLLEDFTMDQFNHIITCVPNGRDTIWLECTSQTAPFGYLGDFTNNRSVVLVDENGGKMVRTPDYTMDQNEQRRLIKAVINDEGNMKGTSFTKLTGMQQDWYSGLVHSVSPERQLEILKERLNLPSYDINKFSYTEYSDAFPVPAIDENLEITVPSYASISGKRLFVAPNVLNRATLKLDGEEERKSPIQLGDAYRDVDTVEITIPNGYTPESVFKDVVLESPFGKYSAKVKVEGNKILYIRVMEKKTGMFPAKDYPALEAFFNAIYKADRSKVVLVKG